MRNGLGQAVLVTELLRHDGPYEMIADDFVVDRCSQCGDQRAEDMRFDRGGGFLCPGCLSTRHAA